MQGRHMSRPTPPTNVEAHQPQAYRTDNNKAWTTDVSTGPLDQQQGPWSRGNPHVEGARPLGP